MHRILIVDDEYYAREGIRQMIREIGGDFEVAGECSDAFQALEFMETDCPDIVLADIQMPVMNGIEFVRQAMTGKKNIKFIIITGHDEFEYAKQALKLNVVDFILKPIDKDEVAEALTRAVQYLDRDKNAVKKGLMEYLRGEPVDPGRLAGWLPREHYDLALLQFEEKDNAEASEYIKISEWIKTQIAGFTGEKYSALQMHSDRIVGLIPHGKGDTGTFLQGLISGAKELFGIPVTAAVKTFATDALDAGYAGVKQLLKEAFYYGGGTLIETSFQAVRSLNTDVIKKQMEAIKIAAGACDKANVQKKSAELFRLLTRMKAPRDLVLECAVNLNLFAQSLVEGEQLSFERMERKYTTGRLTLAEMELHVQQVLRLAVMQVHDNKSDTEDSAVKRAVGILNQRYCEDLSLEQLAGEVYLNPSYLSRKLKEQLGVSFIKYITKLRMEKAIRLLKENPNIEQVAREIGYSNYKRFSDVFRTYTGYLPSAYLKGIDSKGQGENYDK